MLLVQNTIILRPAFAGLFLCSKGVKMAKDDMRVVLYKILTYLYQCLKDGVKPNIQQAQKLCDVNPLYWNAVIDDCIERKLIRVPLKSPFKDVYDDLQITLDGVEYLEEAKPMNRVKQVIGEAFEVVLKRAIEVSKLC